MANFVYVASTFIIYYFALGAAALTIFSVINMWFISLYEACVGELAPESRKKASIAAAIVTILGLLRLGAVKSMLTIVELVRMGALNSMLMVEIAINTVFWMIDSTLAVDGGIDVVRHAITRPTITTKQEHVQCYCINMCICTVFLYGFSRPNT